MGVLGRGKRVFQAIAGHANAEVHVESGKLHGLRGDWEEGWGQVL